MHKLSTRSLVLRCQGVQTRKLTKSYTSCHISKRVFSSLCRPHTRGNIVRQLPPSSPEALGGLKHNRYLPDKRWYFVSTLKIMGFVRATQNNSFISMRLCVMNLGTAVWAGSGKSQKRCKHFEVKYNRYYFSRIKNPHGIRCNIFGLDVDLLAQATPFDVPSQQLELFWAQGPHGIPSMQSSGWGQGWSWRSRSGWCLVLAKAENNTIPAWKEIPKVWCGGKILPHWKQHYLSRVRLRKFTCGPICRGCSCWYRLVVGGTSGQEPQSSCETQLTAKTVLETQRPG